jgi:hypothetical protein
MERGSECTGPGGHAVIPIGDVNPTARTPVLTIGLIALCTLVFLFQATRPPTSARRSTPSAAAT